MEERLKQKINNIKIVIMDVDGVLTDGSIVYGNLNELKFFNVQDGYGVYLLKKAGIKTAIITAKKSNIVRKRAKDMNVSCIYYTRNKLTAYKKIKKRFKLKDDNICYIGDDLLDLPVIKKVGFSATVSDAAHDLKSMVDYVAKKKGGKGAVREIVELILKTKGVWEKVVGICS